MANYVDTSDEAIFGSTDQRCELQDPHEFDKADVSSDFNYTHGNQFNCFEGDRGNMLQAIHEFKQFDTLSWSEEDKTNDKLSQKIFAKMLPFASACLNSRQNGTIHFGIADEKPENAEEGGRSSLPRQVIGVTLPNEEFEHVLLKASRKSFEHFQFNGEKAKLCIRKPRFIPVVDKDLTFTLRYVIEYDIVPRHIHSQGRLFKVDTAEPTGKRRYQAFKRGDSQGDPATKLITDERKYREETIPPKDEERKQLDSTNPDKYQ